MESHKLRYAVLTAAVIGAGVAAPVTVSRAMSPPSRDTHTSAAVAARELGRVPVSFAPNRGQAGPGVDFVAQGAGYGLSLGRGGATVALSSIAGSGEPQLDPASPDLTGGQAAPVATATIGLDVVGADPAAPAQAREALRGQVNYLTGSDPRNWHTGLPTYARVDYRGVYPGVDLSWYGDQGSLEYDFTVAPGADPARIALAFRGADRLSLADDGELIVGAAGGELRQHAPRIYQDSPSGRTPVDGGFVLRGDHQVGFALGPFDHSRPVVIDPVLGYSTFLGGKSTDFGQGIAVDGKGNAYVAGGTSSADFPTTPGAVDPTYAGNQDGFVTKLGPDGGVVYSTFLGGAGRDDADTPAIGPDGEVYVRGITTSPNFPTTPGAFDTTFNGGFDGYVAKLSADGSALAFSTFLGGRGFDSGSGLAVDGQGSAYVVGITGSPDFPVTPGAFGRTFHGVGGPLPPTMGPGDYDAYATKLTPDGSALAYSTLLGGTRLDVAFDVAVDPTGRAALTGLTLSPDFPTTPHAYDTSFNGGFTDAWVARLAPDGSSLAYSTFLGGSGPDGALGIAVEPSGAVHVTGPTSSPDFPTTPGAYDTSFNGDRDVYVARLSPNGSTLRFSTLLGGSDLDVGEGLALGADGSTYVAGSTASKDFPTTPDAYDATFHHGGADGFVARVDVSGSKLLYSSFLGGTRYDDAADVDVGPDGAAFVTGVTRSADFPTTADAYDPTFNGGSDAFVTMLPIGP